MARWSARIDSRDPECFSRVDVADPGHDTLIEERRLDGDATSGERAAQVCRIELRAHRIGTEKRGQR
jgi:hypothetical protein